MNRTFNYWYQIQEDNRKENNRKEIVRQMLEDEEISRLRRENDRLRVENQDLIAAYDLLKAACLLHEDSHSCLLGKNNQLKLEVEALKKDKKELKEKLSKYVRSNLEKDDKIIGLNHAIQDLKTTNMQLNIKNADKEIKIQQLEKREKGRNSAVKFAFDVMLGINVAEQTKEENAALKLEVQKLKGLIEEAKKHVGMANLMLA